MNRDMTVQEAVEDVNEIELERNRLYLCDNQGWIIGPKVAVKP